MDSQVPPPMAPVPEGPMAEPGYPAEVEALLDDLSARAGTHAGAAVHAALDSRWGAVDEAVREWKNPIAWFIRGYVVGAGSVIGAALIVVGIGKLFLEATAR